MLYELLQSRRSIRKFTHQKVEVGKRDLILKSGLLAPSSRGRKPWHLMVVDNEGLLHDLSQAKKHGSSFLKSAPLAIVVAADPEVCDIWVEDASIMSIILQLAAQDLGLGSCWIQIRERMHDDQTSSESYVKALLKLEDKLHVESIIAIGYPDEDKEAYEERPIDSAFLGFNGM